MRKIVIFSISLLVLLLSGCASSVTTQVKSFNQWPAEVQGATFEFAADSTSEQYLEQKFYQQEVANQLQRYGLQPAAAGAKPRFSLRMKINNAKHWVESNRPVFQERMSWVPAVVYKEGGVTKVTQGYWISAGMEWMGYDREQRLIFDYQLTLGIYEGENKVFEASAKLNSARDNSAEMIPYLIKAIFVDFPGNNGQTRRYSFDSNSGQLKN